MLPSDTQSVFPSCGNSRYSFLTGFEAVRSWECFYEVQASYPALNSCWAGRRRGGSAWHEGSTWGVPEICILWLKLACGQKGFWGLKGSLSSCAQHSVRVMLKCPFFLSNMCLDSKFVVMAEMFPSWPHKNIPSPLKHHAPVEKFAALELQGALEHPCKWKKQK